MTEPNKLIQRVPLAPPPTTPIRLGVIGLGHIVQVAHLPAIEALRRRGWPIELAALCDRDTEKLEALHRAYPNAGCSSDAKELFAQAELDAVLIATWPPLTATLAERAIERGWAVLAEKPVSHDVTTLRNLSGRAKARSAIVHVGFNRFWQPFASLLRDSVKDRSLLSATATFQRVGRDEPDFYRDTFGHPVSFLRRFCGELEPVDASWQERSPEKRIPAGAQFRWQTGSGQPVSLASQPDVGRVREIYEFCFPEETLEISYLASLGGPCEAAYLDHWHCGCVTRLGEVSSEDTPEAKLVAQGFVHQMAAFLSAATTGRQDPESPGLTDAARAMDLFDYAFGA